MNKESKKDMELHKMHRERMRKRFLEVGFDGFDDHEILELLLFYCIPRSNTNNTAHLLIRRFGNIKNVLSAPIHELKEVHGVGEKSAIFLKVLNALLSEDLSAKKESTLLDSSEKIYRYLLPYFTDMATERVVVIALDATLRPITAQTLVEGDGCAASITPANIARFLIPTGAYSAVVAHNHPSGFAVPSLADLRSTLELKKSLDVIGVKLIDHIIMVHNDYISIGDSGKNIYTTID